MEEIVKILMQNHRLYEMARIGYVGDYDVLIWTDDPGDIPHFHIRDKNTGGDKFHTCVKIESAEYFHHTGKEDVLNSRERKELVKFLNTINNHSRSNETNWQVLIAMWNMNNSNHNVDMDLSMPDYRELK